VLVLFAALLAEVDPFGGSGVANAHLSAIGRLTQLQQVTVKVRHALFVERVFAGTMHVSSYTITYYLPEAQAAEQQLRPQHQMVVGSLGDSYAQISYVHLCSLHVAKGHSQQHV
jgi:hypothetical protein